MPTAARFTRQPVYPRQAAPRNVKPADKLTGLLYPPIRDVLTPTEMRHLVNSTVGAAMRIAGIVHIEDPADAIELLDGLSLDQRALLPLILAAMVDIEATTDELLGWLRFDAPPALQGMTSVAPSSVLMRQQPRRRRVAECGTQRGFTSHTAHGEEPCTECKVAHRGWERDRKRRKTAARRGTPGRYRRPAAVQDALPLALEAGSAA